MNIQDVDTVAVVGAVLEHWNAFLNERRPRLWIMQENRLAYERKFGVTWGEIEDGRSHRFVPSAFQEVEKASAQYLQAILGSKKYFRAVPRRPGLEAQGAVVEAKIEWDNYRMDFRRTFKDFVKRACVDGNVPWTWVWHSEKAVIRDEAIEAQRKEIAQLGVDVEVDDPAGLGYATQEKTTFMGTRLIVGDMWNYYQDRHPDDPRFAFRVYRTLQRKEYIQAKWGNLLDENGKHIYQHLDELGTDPTWRDTPDSLKKQIDVSMGYQPMEENKVELITFCGDLNVPNVGFFHNVFGVIANRSKLIRFSVNPHAHGLPPWQCFTLIPNPNDPYGLGTGIIEPSLGLFDAINVRVNQVFDANAIAITPPLGVVRNSLTSPHSINWGPGEIIEMRNPGDVVPMQVPKDALQLGQGEISYFKNEIAQTTGIMQSGATNSASEFQGIQGQTNAMLAEAGAQFAQVTADMLRMQLSLNQQCMDPENPILIRLLADEQGQFTDPTTGEVLPPGVYWKNVTGSDIQGEFDFEMVTGAEIAQSNQQTQEEMQFMQMVSQDPAMQAYLNKPEYYRFIMRKKRFPDSYKFIKSDQEVQFEQQQQQQQQLAAQQQQQAMGLSGGPGGQNGAGSQPGPNGMVSTPGQAGSGGSPSGPPSPQQLVGPTGNAGR